MLFNINFCILIFESMLNEIQNSRLYIFNANFKKFKRKSFVWS